MRKYLTEVLLSIGVMQHIIQLLRCKNMPVVDLAALAVEDAVTDQYKEAPWRFGLAREWLYNLENSGTWTLKRECTFGDLGVNCPEA